MESSRRCWASAGEVAIAFALWRGVPGESQIQRGAASAIKSRRRALRLEGAEEKVVRVGRERVGSWGKGDGGGCPSAFTDCSEKSRDRCSSGEFQQTRL